ncbi:MAG TPA: glycosyl hydrolase family 18 protein [Clostridia bacterium]|nr:glycosyl hydrolase family 18 protein [Clostridia bacterium]
MKRYSLIIAAAFITAVISGLFIFPQFWTTTQYSPDKMNFVVEGNIVQEGYSPILENGQLLFPIEAVREYIDPKVHWDENASKVVFTTKDKVLIMKTGKLTAMVNALPVDLNIPVRLVEGRPYIPVQMLDTMFGIELQWIEENNLAVLDYQKNTVQIAEVQKDNRSIRIEPALWSPAVKKDIDKGEILRVFGEREKWYKVRSEDGFIGYIEKKHVRTELIASGSEMPEPVTGSTAWKPDKGKINMTWEYVGNRNPDVSKLKSIEGLDVVSPTWFNIVDKQGTVMNKADGGYVNWAHRNNYKVWALVGNGSDPDITHEFLNNTDTREKITQQLLIYAKLYKLDGINIDFENIYLKDKNMLTQFMRELTPLLKEQGLTVSIDVTFRSSSENWSMCYDRKALAEIVDYIAVMAYDQHWAASPVAGSVAEFGWVESNLIRILEEVPNEKVLLGLPFYTRVWKEQTVDGKLKVSSSAVSMDTVEKVLKERKPKVTWNEESGQHYTEYKVGKVTNKIWIEDNESINLKTSLVHKYNLAGAASWRKGFESEDIWAVLQDSLKVKQDYTQWANANSAIAD